MRPLVGIMLLLTKAMAQTFLEGPYYPGQALTGGVVSNPLRIGYSGGTLNPFRKMVDTVVSQTQATYIDNQINPCCFDMDGDGGPLLKSIKKNSIGGSPCDLM